VFNKKEGIMTILRDFEANLKSPSIFISKNLGILLYGEPGTGKTSFIKAACNYFKRNALIIDFNKLKSKKKLIKAVRTAIERKMIIVFDEFDLLLKSLQKDGKQDVKNLTKIETAIKMCTDEKLIEELHKKYVESCSTDDAITIYTLLTLLDGLCEHEERIIIATTNNPESINKALLRPGRFDIRLNLGYFDRREIRELLGKIFKVDNVDEKLKDCAFEEHVWSPAEIISLANIKKDLDKTVEYLLANKPEYRS
jgi:mitochondrial chaperone BCS1